MIFLPVKPASPCGPPTTNRPVGLTWYVISGGRNSSEITNLIISSTTAYAARHVAKNIVAAELADRCEVELSYAIGVVEPISIMIETFGTSTIPDEKLTELVRKHFDLTPAGIIQRLDLRKPIYSSTAAYGHFGREEPGFTWELTDYATHQIRDF